MGCSDHEHHERGCDACCRYARLYAKRRARAIAEGTWQHSVPIKKVRAHLRKLMRVPMTLKAISQISGVPYQTVHGAASDKGRTYVTGPVAVALLAVQPVIAARVGRVPALPYARMMQALAAIGYSNPRIKRATGLSVATVYDVMYGKRQWIGPRVVEAIKAAYEKGCAELYAVYPAAVLPDADRRTLDAARANGWVGPYAWDDDTIGNPKARPGFDAPRPHRTDVLQTNVDDGVAGRLSYEQFAALTTAERIRIVEILLARGWSRVRVGEWLCWPQSESDTKHEHSPITQFCGNHGIAIAPLPVRERALAEVRQVLAMAPPAAA